MCGDEQPALSAARAVKVVGRVKTLGARAGTRWYHQPHLPIRSDQGSGLLGHILMLPCAHVEQTYTL
jgi:hypothetical protein